MPAQFVEPTRFGGQRLYYWCGVGALIFAALFLIALLAGHVIQDRQDIPLWIGGYCAILAAALATFQILEHLSHFGDPDCQCKVVRILFMVPLYAMTSWLSMVFPGGVGDVLNLIRDAYEAYALYNFFALMMEQMGGIDNLYRELMAEEREPVDHVWPLNHCMEAMRVTPTFVRRCRLSLVQFMILKPILAITVIALVASHRYGELFDLGQGHFWTFIIYNTTYTIALVALWYFYLGMEPFLVGKNALPKFLCIKAIIFMTYWQGMIIEILEATAGLPTFDYWSEDNAATGLQDLLVCIEMLFVSFAHKFCFTVEEYSQRSHDIDFELPDMVPARRSKLSNLALTLRHDDIRKDVVDTVRNR
jgi:hypothetical protein